MYSEIYLLLGGESVTMTHHTDPADILFICSLEDLNCLHDYLVAAIAGDDLSEIPRLWNQQIGVIRSHPAATPIFEQDEFANEKHDAAIIAQAREETVDAVLKDLRKNGWMVAIHNDYRQDGKYYTFWLMTSNDGRYLKGESSMERGGDISARNQIKNAIKSLSSTKEQSSEANKR